ncbi:hypothetical protein CFN78_10665 [Amycolatopsis antarctica]|uniref:Uncharacterized protein n=1 Tax=Amycolatopsis antarctica TaxID=1854586 RepID=A0A263D5J1_9PSEU|nr:hypothetical protein [Amycolatopsis antarctica]OZM73308.1 hypothetical protein CFN78_10665 [Amycolatopsis antarctica]
MGTRIRSHRPVLPCLALLTVAVASVIGNVLLSIQGAGELFGVALGILGILSVLGLALFAGRNQAHRGPSGDGTRFRVREAIQRAAAK